MMRIEDQAVNLRHVHFWMSFALAFLLTSCVETHTIIDLEAREFDAAIFFDCDQSTLDPVAKIAVDELIYKLQSQRQHVAVTAIIVAGHADNLEADDQELSVSRANSVKAYLFSKGFQQKLILAEGKGNRQPIAPNMINGKDNPGGRAKNRRVVVAIVGYADQ